jgi:hypothetical protein
MKKAMLMDMFELDLSKQLISSQDRIYEKEWFSGTKAKQWKPFYERNPKKARFALRKRGVCYLATDCGRIDFEIGEFFKEHKTKNAAPDFSKELWPRMTGQGPYSEKKQEIKGAFRIDSSVKIFNFSIGDSSLARTLLLQRDEQTYESSSNFAKFLFNHDFDGILYNPCTLIRGILGPCNDPMLVLFEPGNIERKLFSYFHINAEI